MSASPRPRPSLNCIGDLVVDHVLVHVALVAAEHRIAEAGAAHALEHHLGEQTLELLRGLAQRRRIVGCGAAAHRRELLEVVGIDARRIGTRQVARIGNVVRVDAQCHGVRQMTMSSARSAPDFLQRFENRDQVAGRGAHLVDRAHDVVEIDAGVEHEHARRRLLDLDDRALAARRRCRRGRIRIRLAHRGALGDRHRRASRATRPPASRARASR